jgi:hypothetical protein
MLDKSQFPVELNLNQAIDILPQGHSLIPKYASQLPPAWLHVLTEAVPPDAAVELLWQPLTYHARGFVFRLASITEQLALFVSPDRAFRPCLFYASNAGSLEHAWLGGSPANEEDIQRWEQNHARLLPASYRKFAQLHNGFMENKKDRLGLYPLQEVSLLVQPEPGDPDTSPEQQLLAFASLSDGNLQCYDLNATRMSGDALTVEWRQISGASYRPQSFWSFLKDFTIHYL